MRQIASPISTLARPQLRSPSPSDMDPTDAHDEDRRPTAGSPLKTARRLSSPAAQGTSAAEYPSPPQRVTKPHHRGRDGIEKAVLDASGSTKLNAPLHTVDKISRLPSSSPPTASPYSATARPTINSPYNTIIMHTKPRPDSTPSKLGDRRRPARMPYTAEQDDFIRFVRDDLSLSWEVSAQFYNDYWHADGEGKREIPGLQSRYYRLLEQPMRDRKRKVELGPTTRRNKESKDSLGRPEEGILAKTNRRYYWMEGMFENEEQRRLARMEMARQEEAGEPSAKRQRRDSHDAHDASENTDQDDDDDYDDGESPEDANQHEMDMGDGSSSGSHDDDAVGRR